MSLYLDQVGESLPSARYRWASAAIVLISVAAIGRLWQLQIWQLSTYSSKSSQQIWRSIELPAQRGRIFDRNGQALVLNKGVFQLQARRTWQGDDEDLISLLELPISAQQLYTSFQSARKQTVGDWITIWPNLTYAQMATVESRAADHPNLAVRQVPARSFVLPDSGAHLLGYVSEASPKEIARLVQLTGDSTRYKSGSQIGKNGIERTYERDLAGRSGQKLIKVDAFGRVKDEGKREPPAPGQDLYLAIDGRLQALASELLAGRRGAIVALDPDDGAVLAMESHPTYSLQQISERFNSEMWSQFISDPDHPMENRAIRGQYPPGSTYKPVVALAALHFKVVTPSDRVFCRGSLRVGKRVFRCWKKEGHGSVNLHKAIAQSCDVFFYDMGLRLGPDRIAQVSRWLGLGLASRIDLPGEKLGLIPTTDWKQERFRESWQGGETVIAAIGQGYNTVTPLQLARAYAAIANGGRLVTPHAARSISDATGVELKDAASLATSETIPIRPEYLEIVRSGLVAAVNDPGSTGGWSRVPGVKVAGKTGTAQVVRQEKREDETEEELPERLRDHAWFVGFAPAEAPKIVVAVIIENGGHGGSAAAPLVGRMMKTYLIEEKQAHADSHGSGG